MRWARTRSGILVPRSRQRGFVGGPAFFGGQAPFNPASLFTGGVQGYAYDLTDKSKLFQLSGGTTAVVNDAEPIGYATDLSGNGHHATQSTAANRPLYKTGLPRALFDGVASYLTAGLVNLSGSDKVTVIVAMNLTGSSNHGTIGHGTTGAGDFNVLYSSGSAAWRGSLYGSTGNSQTIIATADEPAIPHTKVFSTVFDIGGSAATDEIKWRINGAAVAETVVSVGPAGTGNLSNANDDIGRMTAGGNFYLAGSIYRVIVINRLLTTAELLKAEGWCGAGIGYIVIPEIPPDGDADYNLLDSYGQSLGSGVQGTPVLSSTTRFNDLMFTSGVHVTANGLNYSTLIPLVESTATESASPEGETPVSGMAEMIHELQGGAGNAFIGVANAFPGLTIAQCQQGQSVYNNFLTSVSNGRRRSREQSKQFKVRAFPWMQGESDGGNTSYAANMNTLLGTMNTDCKAITLQSENLWLLSYQLDRADIALQQLLASDTYANIRVCFPTYHLPHYVDNVHLTNNGYKIAGAYFGYAYKKIILDGVTGWQPLKCLSHSTSGAVCTLTFNPVGSLALDTTLVASQTNSGFSMYQSNGTTVVPLTSVVLSGTNQVVITATGPIPTGAIVKYGFVSDTDHTAGIAKGNLRDTQGNTVVFNGGGLNYALHNWCVLFKRTVN